MSTFGGKITEIAGISVDRFDEINLRSSLYFLSHCHTDHMKGLGDNFFRILIDEDKYLYCSPISKAFLLGIYPTAPEDRIIEIEHAIPKTVSYKIIKNGITSNDCLTVTTSPAGHCPGSVMFVFNKDDKTILYTGDFRINPKDLPKLNPLNDRINDKNYPKKFDAIYLDTTFLSLDYQYFPSRSKSCFEISRAIDNWLKSDEKNVVSIECSANYGPENLFMEIFKLLKIKIHVKNVVYRNYRRISDLAVCVTDDGIAARIHACNSKLKRDQLSCRTDVKCENIFTVVPSAQRWKGKNLRNFVEYDSSNDRRLYVCQSMHSSYQELESFVDYFKPAKIIPCVVPKDSAIEFDKLMLKLRRYDKMESCDVAEDEDNQNFELVLPDVENFRKNNFKSKYFSDDEEN